MGENTFDLSDDDLEAALMADEAEVEAEAPETVETPAVEETVAEQQPAYNPDGPGDLRVALQQEREQRRQIEAAHQAESERLRALEAYIAQQQAQAQQAQQQPVEPPDWFEDPNAALQYHMQPLLAQQQQQQAYIQQLESERELFMFSQRPGQEDAPQMIRYFDEAMPHMAHLNIEQKYLMTKGAMYSNPQYVEQMVAKQVEERVAQTLAKQGTPSAQGHTTIGHTSSSTAPVGDKPVHAMSDAELDAKLRSMGA